MISPREIQEKEFSRGLKGYKEDEVNDFLNQIMFDLEKLMEENKQLQAQNQQAEEGLEKYKGAEGSVLQTLETAKGLMSDISASAEKRAEILLRNAELDAQLIQREAQEAVARLTEENAALEARVTKFRETYKQMLESELQRLDTLATELFPEFGMDDFDDLPQEERGKSGAIAPVDSRKQTVVDLK